MKYIKKSALTTSGYKEKLHIQFTTKSALQQIGYFKPIGKVLDLTINELKKKSILNRYNKQRRHYELPPAQVDLSIPLICPDSLHPVISYIDHFCQKDLDGGNYAH